MTINKYFIFSPQASEEQIQPVLTEKEVQRQEALKQAQTHSVGGFLRQKNYWREQWIPTLFINLI